MRYCQLSKIPIFLRGSLAAFCCLLSGCCPLDPTCRGATSPCPGYFWNPPDTYVQCPCDYELEKDEDLQKSLELLQKHDVAIANLIDVALLNNPSTQITWANARAAAFSVEIAKSALYPNIVLNEELTYSNGWLDDGPPDVIPPAVTPVNPPPPQSTSPHLLLNQLHPNFNRALLDPTQTVVDVNGNATTSTTIIPNNSLVELTTLTSDISLSYLLLDFGGRRATINAAKEALYNSNWTHNRQIQQVISSVLNAYYIYMGLTALLVARESDLKNAQTNYESARDLFEAGVKNKLDVLQAQTDLINIELNIVDLEGQKEVAYGQLANALGLPSQAQFHVPGIPEDLPVDVVLATVDQLISQAKRQRPDLAAAYALHDQRKEEVIIARSSGLPTLQAFVDVQENMNITNSNFNNRSISASLVVSAPLFSGFLYMNRERRAIEILRGTCANIRQIELNITLDVITSYANFEAAIKSLKYSDEYLKYSEESYDAALAIYREGLATILDLLNAQRALANARAQKIRSRTQWAIALSNLSFAIGTIGTAEEIKPKQQRQKRKK